MLLKKDQSKDTGIKMIHEQDREHLLRMKEYTASFAAERHSAEVSRDGEFRVTMKEGLMHVHASNISANRVLDGVVNHMLRLARNNGVTDVEAWSDSVALEVRNKMLAMHKTFDGRSFTGTGEK